MAKRKNAEHDKHEEDIVHDEANLEVEGGEDVELAEDAELEDADLEEGDDADDEESDGDEEAAEEGGKKSKKKQAEEPLDEAARFHLLRVVEAILFASAEPLEVSAIVAQVGHKKEMPGILSELAEQYAGRGVNLVKRDERWCFRTAADLAGALKREHVQTRRLSRAAVETLATIAYHQPVSRPEIETIRGVTTSRGTLDVLIETGWIKPGKRRNDVPGKPLTWVTTQSFLDQFGLESLADLPGLEDLRAAGLLDVRPAIAALDKFSDQADEDDLDGESGEELDLLDEPVVRDEDAADTSSEADAASDDELDADADEDDEDEDDLDEDELDEDDEEETGDEHEDEPGKGGHH
jgi:segregation and condensation protein B